MSTNRRIYRIWSGMMQRCYNPDCISYSRYGGRGIKVCDGWHLFRNFEADMGKNYRDNLSLDRIDFNKDYKMSNCKWSTRKEQANNRRDNRLVTMGGVTKNIQQWSETTGLPYMTIYMRLFKYNWPVNKALENSVGRR